MVTSVFFCFVGLLATGRALMCYSCDNTQSQSCGQDFQAYQFEAVQCDEAYPHKCGKQIQEPNQDGWVGVMRGCYQLGVLEGMNDSNGCHSWYSDSGNFSAIYCYCDMDLCNSALPVTAPARPLLSLWALTVFTALWLCRSWSSSSFFSIASALTPGSSLGNSATSSQISLASRVRMKSDECDVFQTHKKKKEEEEKACHEQPGSEEGERPTKEARSRTGWTVGLREELRRRHSDRGKATSSPHRK